MVKQQVQFISNYFERVFVPLLVLGCCSTWFRIGATSENSSNQFASPQIWEPPVSHILTSRNIFTLPISPHEKTSLVNYIDSSQGLSLALHTDINIQTQLSNTCAAISCYILLTMYYTIAVKMAVGRFCWIMVMISLHSVPDVSNGESVCATLEPVFLSGIYFLIINTQGTGRRIDTDSKQSLEPASI